MSDKMDGVSHPESAPRKESISSTEVPRQLEGTSQAGSSNSHSQDTHMSDGRRSNIQNMNPTTSLPTMGGVTSGIANAHNAWFSGPTTTSPYYQEHPGMNGYYPLQANPYLSSIPYFNRPSPTPFGTTGYSNAQQSVANFGLSNDNSGFNQRSTNIIGNNPVTLEYGARSAGGVDQSSRGFVGVDVEATSRTAAAAPAPSNSQDDGGNINDNNAEEERLECTEEGCNYRTKAGAKNAKSNMRDHVMYNHIGDRCMFPGCEGRVAGESVRGHVASHMEKGSKVCPWPGCNKTQSNVRRCLFFHNHCACRDLKRQQGTQQTQVTPQTPTTSGLVPTSAASGLPLTQPPGSTTGPSQPPTALARARQLLQSTATSFSHASQVAAAQARTQSSASSGTQALESPQGPLLASSTIVRDAQTRRPTTATAPGHSLAIPTQQPSANRNLQPGLHWPPHQIQQYTTGPWVSSYQQPVGGQAHSSQSILPGTHHTHQTVPAATTGTDVAEETEDDQDK